MKSFLWAGTILGVALMALLLGCAGSFQDSVVQDRLADYKAASKAYHETEEEYLTLLFNLERMPDDPYLLDRKKELMSDLIQLRSVMLQSRSELDDAVQRWELEIKEDRGVEGAGRFSSNAFYNSLLRSSMKKVSSSIRISSSVSLSSSSRIQVTMSSAVLVPRVDLSSSTVPILPTPNSISSGSDAPALQPAAMSLSSSQSLGSQANVELANPSSAIFLTSGSAGKSSYTP